ncbi:hypothetical protein, partial [Caldisericum sp.]|uniref:hypothetical protein n=1 Tax=Caldisericum sp. TaxID=2499687 RepID=UPI003D0BDDA5
QTLKEIIKEGIDESVLGELAKIPGEIIDKEGAQKYIKWRFYTSQIIATIVAAIMSFFFFLLFGIAIFYGITTYSINDIINLIKQNAIIFLSVTLFVTIMIIFIISK